MPSEITAFFVAGIAVFVVPAIWIVLRRRRTVSGWFWLALIGAALVALIVGLAIDRFVRSAAGPWLSQHDAVEPLTVGLVAVAVLLGAGVLVHHRPRRD